VIPADDPGLGPRALERLVGLLQQSAVNTARRVGLGGDRRMAPSTVIASPSTQPNQIPAAAPARRPPRLRTSRARGSNRGPGLDTGMSVISRRVSGCRAGSSMPCTHSFTSSSGRHARIRSIDPHCGCAQLSCAPVQASTRVAGPGRARAPQRKGRTDADRNRRPAAVYGDQVGTIEPYSIEHIPSRERHGRTEHLFLLWFAANLTIATTPSGSCHRTRRAARDTLLMLAIGTSWSGAGGACAAMGIRRLSADVRGPQELRSDRRISCPPR